MDIHGLADVLPRLRSILAHETRRRVFEHLRGHPGASRRDLVHALGIPAPTLRHHLDVMGASQLVASRKEGREILYSSGPRVEAIGSLRSPWRRRIVELLLESPRTQKELAEATGLSQRLVAYHLSLLPDVVSSTHARPRRYSVREPVRVRASIPTRDAWPLVPRRS